jgi:hypothetical protein
MVELGEGGGGKAAAAAAVGGGGGVRVLASGVVMAAAAAKRVVVVVVVRFCVRLGPDFLAFVVKGFAFVAVAVVVVVGRGVSSRKRLGLLASYPEAVRRVDTMVLRRAGK